METVINVNKLSSHYGEKQILTGITLSVYKKEIMVIMGRSGSGKSTLLRHILGLKPVTTGTITILDQDISALDKKALYELRRNFGVAFQNGALFSSMNVRENVELPLREHTRLDAMTIHIMSRLKLELMDLAEHGDRMPSELSGGMLKRAGLARAVVMDPKLLFFDEPSAGLDPVSSAELDEHILQLRDALNMTILVVTHDLESAFHIADRITVLDKGKQIMTGTCAEIRASTDVRIINMLGRRPRDNEMDADAYLERLTDDD